MGCFCDFHEKVAWGGVGFYVERLSGRFSMDCV